MSRHPANPEAELRKRICDCRAVIVVGTGISIAASIDPKSRSPHPQASWAGLLKSGLKWLKDHRHISQKKAAALLTLIDPVEEPETYDFISVAQHVTRLMGGVESVHFKKWLKQTIGTIEANSRSTLDALETLRSHGNLLATTNYDGLLLDNAGSRKPVTWNEPIEFIRAARNQETDKILFLHGYWRRPQSVILDWTSYEEVVRDRQYREDFAALWNLTTWIYVGCGANGLSDPDFGLLLERYGKRARQADLWDFCLVRSDQREELQAHFDNQQINVFAVSYGASHDALPLYLRALLPAPIPASTPAPAAAKAAAESDIIPKPPAFYAEPDYIGSHRFVGRDSQLRELDDWAKPADPTNVLLFEAIGGNGKSMLTWEWTIRHAAKVRADEDTWAGRFWYSFYERGALMSDFCKHAIAYMTGRPLDESAKKKTAILATELLAQLHAKPWLLILDGLERVLVAYHRIDAAEMRDEEADSPTDRIVHRDPRDAIRDEDDDLLRSLAAAAPSKILVSTRLVPRVLLNPSGQPIRGVKRITLPGLRPPDAERLLRSCGIEGDSAAIQHYLTTNCDNHPLVIGVLGGLINNYLPARGNFDAWQADPDGGAKLDLADLDLTQRRNHILDVALDDLPPKSRQLLSTLALLGESADYKTLSAFNPHLPPEPEGVPEPELPVEHRRWLLMPDAQKAQATKNYEADLAQFNHTRRDWLESQEYRESRKKLETTVTTLEKRGLLQYDHRTQRYDLHPVVRGVAAGGMKSEDKNRYGQRVVDHFSSLPRNPYEQAKTLEDLHPGPLLVRTLLKLGRLQQAVNVYRGELSIAMMFNVEAFAEILSLLRPFFPASWNELPTGLEGSDAWYLANDAASVLYKTNMLKEALKLYETVLVSSLEVENAHPNSANYVYANNSMLGISNVLNEQNLLFQKRRIVGLALDLAAAYDDPEGLFLSRLWLFRNQVALGQWEEAEANWQILDQMGRAWGRNRYRPGTAEFSLAEFHYQKGTLKDEHLVRIERLATKGKNRTICCRVHRLRGLWWLEQSEWALAAASFAEAVRMSRERGITDASSETGLAIAKHHLDKLAEPQREAERLTALRQPDHHRLLALFWLALSDHEQAKHHALAAYKRAWADGEPYVNRHALTKTTELLQQMNVKIPNLPLYDPAEDKPFAWEADVYALIEKLRAVKGRQR